MEARQLIDRASYGPETLEVLFQAFDAAWKEHGRMRAFVEKKQKALEQDGVG